MEKKEKNTRKRSLIIDIVLLAIMLIVSVISFYIAYTFGLIPMKWITIFAVVVGCSFLILLLLNFKKLPTWGLVMKRFVLIVLTVCIGTCGYFLDKSRTTINKISKTTVNEDGSTTKKSKMFVVVKKDADIQDLDDLKDQTIGFQNGSDEDNATYMKTLLQKEISFQEREEMDYTALITDLENNAVAAIAMSETFYNMSAANIDKFSEETKIIETYERELTDNQKKHKDITKETFTVYLSGLDNVGSPDQQTRTDTNLILIVNPRANHIDMVSLPRDGFIPNTATNNVNDKFTHTGMYGIDTSVETLQQFFGIPIDYYARVSFNSLIQIVDTIDGIDVDVEIDFCEQDENRSFKKDDLICLKKGEQHLNGKQALAYSRHRKTLGYDNPGRERAQQRIIKAIINKLVSPSAITYVNELLEIAPNYVITDMPANQITKFVSSELENMKPWTISSISSDNGVYDTRYVASIAESEGKKDVYLFNKNEVHALLNAYDGASKQLEMKEYHFDLTNLYKDTPAVNDDPNIVWDSMADVPH